MTWLKTELVQAYEIQTQKLGIGKDYHQEGKFLNRLIRCTDAGSEVEADPRHAELVVEQLEIEDKGVSIPLTSGLDEEDTEEDVPLEAEDITRYSSVLARCNYLARGHCSGAIPQPRGIARGRCSGGHRGFS